VPPSLQDPSNSDTSYLLDIGTGSLGGALVVLEHRRRRLDLASATVAIGIVMFASVWTPPRTSNDLWSYTMYGRMVSVYETSPYEHTPAEFRPDPFVHRVSRVWRHRASLYGPLFAGVAAVGAFIAGP